MFTDADRLPSEAGYKCLDNKMTRMLAVGMEINGGRVWDLFWCGWLTGLFSGLGG